MSRVAVVGSVNLDLVVAVSQLPATGETVIGSDVAFRPGGKGGNQAVAARRLGAETLLVAAVGDDRFGTELRSALAREGLSGDLGTIDGAVTGIAMIVVGSDGGNTVVVAPGANALLDDGRLGGLPDLLVTGSVLALQLEIPLGTCLEAARIARRCGATVQLNAAPLPKPGEPVFADLLTTTDVLVVNEGEARQLSAPATTGPGTDDWGRLAGRLCRLGPATTVITLGAAGAVAANADGVHVQPGFAVDVVDPTGAGDAFCGALAAALGDGRPLAEAVRRGCAAGAIACTRTGAQSALPTADELESFLAGRTEVPWR